MMVTVYTKPDCPACRATLSTLRDVASEYGLVIVEVDTGSPGSPVDRGTTGGEAGPPRPHAGGHVDQRDRGDSGDRGDRGDYADLPVVEIEGGRLGKLRLQAPIDELELRMTLELAWRASVPNVRVARSRQVLGSPADRLASFIGQRWLGFSTAALGVFVALPWLAPVFAALGWWGLADPIYAAYAVT
jgi:hypothetical protein